MFKKQLKFIITIVLVLGLSISGQSLIASWQEPIIVAPSGNIKKPINEGLAWQEKLGSFDIGGDMGISKDLIIDGHMAINSATSSSRLRLLDNVGGPDLYIEGLGVNPELALGDNSNYWSIYSDETNSHELRFWRGNNRMALTDSGTLKIREICDEDGANCMDISSGIGTLIGSVPKNAVVAFNSTTCPTDWQIADGTNGTPDLRGRFIRGLDSGGSSNDPDSRSLRSYQADEFKSHTHNLQPTYETSDESPRETLDSREEANSGISQTLTTTATGGAETRPKNIALTYCVKMTAGGSNIDWSDIENIPADIADGDDVGGAADFPSGAWCGMSSDHPNFTDACKGHNPKVSCPPSYTRRFDGHDFWTCIKD